MEDQSNLEMQPTTPKTNEEIWEQNHEKINRTISAFIYEHKRTPTCGELAAETKLSRKTVQNHLKEYEHHPLNRDEMERFRLLSAKVLAKVADLALEGDLNAIKLFFQVVNKIERKPGEKNRDPYYNVYIADKVFMWQNRLNRLEAEDQHTIETILRTALEQAESDDNEAAGADNEATARNMTWENNHLTILNAVTTIMNETRYMPSHVELAAATGLSRQTIIKHIREFTYQPLHLAEIEQLRGLSSEILTIVSNHALTGNLKAAKLYFRLMTDTCPLPDANPSVPNNYLLLNNTRITQEVINKLNPEQLGIIETILRKKTGY